MVKQTNLQHNSKLVSLVKWGLLHDKCVGSQASVMCMTYCVCVYKIIFAKLMIAIVLLIKIGGALPLKPGKDIFVGCVKHINYLSSKSPLTLFCMSN